MNTIHDKYGLDHDLVRLLVELDFDPEMYYKININEILYRYNIYGE